MIYYDPWRSYKGFNMNEKKPWQSKTLWGAFLLLISFVAGQFGVDINPDEQASITNKIVTSVDAISAVIGWMMVIWGRFTANKKVSF